MKLRIPKFLSALVLLSTINDQLSTASANQMWDVLDFGRISFNGPVGSVYSAPDGWIYGVTTGGGLHDKGMVYKVWPATPPYTHTYIVILHSFGGNVMVNGQKVPDGVTPTGGLIQDSQGMLWGTTTGGGGGIGGTIFSLSTNGDGAIPPFAGTPAGLGVTRGNVNNYTLVHSFGATTATLCNGQTVFDGFYPLGPLTLSADGNTLYGTTSNGGPPPPTGNFRYGDGVVFSITRDGTCYNILHTFTGAVVTAVNPNGSPAGWTLDGAYPSGNLVLSGSWLYGTTRDFGENPLFNPPQSGFAGSQYYGSVYALNVAGDMNGAGYSSIWAFTGGQDEGNPEGLAIKNDPQSGLSLFGTATYGAFGEAFQIYVDTSGAKPVLANSPAGNFYVLNPSSGAHVNVNGMTVWPIFSQWPTEIGKQSGLGVPYSIKGVPTGYPLCPLPPNSAGNPSLFVGVASGVLTPPSYTLTPQATIFEIGDSTATLSPTPLLTVPNLTPVSGAVLGNYLRVLPSPPFVPEQEASSPPLYTTLQSALFTEGGYQVQNGELLGYFYLPTEALAYNSATRQVTLTMEDPPGVVWQSANSLLGPWMNMPGNSNSYTVDMTNSSQFFRIARIASNIPPASPAATTLPIQFVGSNTVVLNGFVLANGADATAWFEYGNSTNYGSTTSSASVAAINSLFASNSIPALNPGTFYHVQLVASNSAGTSYGGDLTFTAPGPGATAPGVVTLAATSISNNAATLNGQLTLNGADTAYWWEYGVSTNYVNFTPMGFLSAQTFSNTIPTNTTIGSLAPGTLYHFQLVASNALGLAYGGDLTFTNPVGAPLVQTLPASEVSDSGAYLNGAIDANGADSLAWFEYGTNQLYGSTSTPVFVGAGSAALISNSIPVLSPGIVYHYQLVASNSAGTAFGGDATFLPIVGSLYVGNNLSPSGVLGADAEAPLVILGEYSPSGPLSNSTVSLVTGTLKDVKFYGQNYNFTLYAIGLIGNGPGTNEQTFQVTAAQVFSGVETNVGMHTLPVSGFNVYSGELLAFAGTGPYYPQTNNDATNSDATYEDSTSPGSFTATAPSGAGMEFIVGLNPDTNATYEYIPDSFTNQGRSYAIGVDVENSFISPATLGTTSLVVGPNAGSNSVVLGIGPTNSWSARANDNWLHLGPSFQSGAGSTNIIFSYDTNLNATRVGTLTIAGQTLTVTQAGSNYVQAPGPLTTLVGSGGDIGLAVDGTGNVYFASGATIYEWSPASDAATTLTAGASIEGMALGPSNDLYFADTGNDVIGEYMPATSNELTVVSTGINSFPFGVAVDNSGNVFYDSAGGEGIFEWNATDDTQTTFFLGLDETYGLAGDAASNLYIAESGSDAVAKFNLANSNVVTVVTLPDAPDGVFVDGTGALYVTDDGSHVFKWTPAGGTNVTTLVSGLVEPVGVAVDGTGNVYVSDHSAIWELPYAFVDPTSKSESASAGSDTLSPVLPATENLLPPFYPSSDSAWLTISGISNGAVSFSFTTTTTNRTGHITLLGQSIAVSQPGN